MDRLNEGRGTPRLADTTPRLTGSVFTVAKVKQSLVVSPPERSGEFVTCAMVKLNVRGVEYILVCGL